MEELEKIISVPPGMTAQDFEAWMGINENLDTSAVLTNYDICEAASNTNQKHLFLMKTNHKTLMRRRRRPPTSAEMSNELQILRLGVQTKAEANGFHKQYNVNKNVLLMIFSVKQNVQ